MKGLSLLVWISQLGLSIVMPPLGFILLAQWLRSSLGLGSWVLWIGIILGIYGAIQGLRSSLKTMDRISRREDKGQAPVSFNDHS